MALVQTPNPASPRDDQGPPPPACPPTPPPSPHSAAGRAPGFLRSRDAPFVAVALVVVLATSGWFVFVRDDASTAASTAASVSRLVAATSAPMDRAITAEGTVAAQATDDLSFATSGTVTAVNVAGGGTGGPPSGAPPRGERRGCPVASKRW